MTDETPGARIFVLHDYREPTPAAVPCRVTFYGTVFNNDLEIQQSLRFSIVVTDGDFGRLIEEVRQDGGIYSPPGTEMWFLPWPCSSVRVESIAAS